MRLEQLNNALNLLETYVPCGFENYSYNFKPTLDEIEEFVDADLFKEESAWGCRDIELCGCHFILLKYENDENNGVLYTYTDASGGILLKATKAKLLSVKRTDSFLNSCFEYSRDMYMDDAVYNGKKVFFEQPIKWKNKNALTDDEEKLLNLIDSLIDNDFMTIFEVISKYRLQRYNSGLVEDIKFPFEKLDIDFHKEERKQFFQKIKDNYDIFPYFKKYCDNVFFYLDK